MSAAVHAEAPRNTNLESMTVTQFKASGLDKLTSEELDNLQNWINQQHQETTQNKVDNPLPATTTPVTAAAAAAEPEAAEDNFGLTKKKKKSNEVLKSRILGTFKGWNGETLFTLENGQVWKQRLRGTWSGRLENPEVEIYKNMLGYYNLRIISNGRKVGVKRIK